MNNLAQSLVPVSGTAWQQVGDIEDIQNSAVKITVIMSEHRPLASPMQVVTTLKGISESLGDYIKFPVEYSYLPTLIGNDNRPVFLLHVIESIDGIIDYEEIQNKLPTLTLSQIGGAMQFMRKVAQVNMRGYDLDELEAEDDANDEQLLNTLRASLAAQETPRVLFDDNRSR